jgi:uncharacterized protein (DUF927 family)
MFVLACQNLFGGPLSSADYARLDQRWISRDFANAAMLRRVTSLEGAEIVGRQGKPGDYSGIIIPYFDPLQRWVRDYRLRRDHPEIEFDSHGSRKECHRYLAPPGKGNMLYVPLGADPELLQNTDLPLVITEGEFKTIALWRAAWHAVGESSDSPSFLPIGLSGVYNWRTRTPKTFDADGHRVDAPGPIADLLWIAWSGRRVIILFDSDIKTKFDVQVARERLTTDLQGRGAEVGWFPWPKDVPHDQKGVDDYLAARGPNEFLALLATARPVRNRGTAATSPSPAGNGASAEPKTRSFETREDGVYCRWSDHTKAPVWVCPPLEIAARTSDFNEEGCGKMVRFRNRQGQEKRCVIASASLIGEGPEALQRLIAMGFKPKRDRKSLELLKDYVYESEPEKDIRCVSQIGWHGQYFVFPDASIGPNGSNEVLFHSEYAPEHLYRTAGSLEEWRSSIGSRCAGNSRLMFAVSVAFAAALLDLLKADGIGFHFRGLSSTGKTTALLAAGSVWGGGGQNGFLDTWRATANGLEARAALHNHALLCLDEFGEVSEREVGEIVYALSNGGGKGRMTKHITSRASNTFKLLYLSSGERSLSDAMKSAGKHAKGGQEVRLVDLEADAGGGMGVFENLHGFDTPAKLSDFLSQAAKTHYGTPIRPFLQYLADHRGEISEAALEFRRSFLRRNVPMDAVGEVYRVATLFALVSWAGLLASQLGITGWSEGAAVSTVESVFQSWLISRGNAKTPRDVEIGIQATRAFLETNGSSRFQNIDNPQERVNNRAGYRQRAVEGWLYYLYPKSFQDEICNGYDYKAVAREMVARGFMLRNEGRHLGNKKSISGEGRPRLIEILPAIFEDSEDPEESAGSMEDEEACGACGAGGAVL